MATRCDGYGTVGEGGAWDGSGKKGPKLLNRCGNGTQSPCQVRERWRWGRRVLEGASQREMLSESWIKWGVCLWRSSGRDHECIAKKALLFDVFPPIVLSVILRAISSPLCLTCNQSCNQDCTLSHVTRTAHVTPHQFIQQLQVLHLKLTQATSDMKLLTIHFLMLNYFLVISVYLIQTVITCNLFWLNVYMAFSLDQWASWAPRIECLFL